MSDRRPPGTKQRIMAIGIMVLSAFNIWHLWGSGWGTAVAVAEVLVVFPIVARATVIYLRRRRRTTPT